MEQHNPNHSSITLPDIYFSSDKKEKVATNMAHIPTTSEPQDGSSTSNTTLSKIVSNSAHNTVGGQDINKTANNLSSENDGSSKEQSNSKLVSISPNTIIEGKLKDGEIRVFHSKEGSLLTKPIVSKAVQNRSLSVKSIPLCIAKSDPPFSVCANQVNVKKFQKTNASPIERNQTVQKLGTSSPVETHVQVNNMKRQCVVESDESIYPVRVEKKVAMKDTNLAQVHGHLMATETVVSVSNNSGLSLIKAVYNGDSGDGLLEDSKNEGINLDENKPCLKQAPTDFCGIKNLLNSDVNGIHTQVVHESPLKDKAKCPENNINVVNGDENVNKSVGNEIVQVVSTSQSSHSSVLPKISYVQTKSVAGISTPKLLSTSPNVPVQQNIHNSKNVVFSSATPAKSVTPTSCSTSTQSRKIVGPSKMPKSATSFNVDETQSINPLKTVETSRQKIIIDEDTSEVLLIMNTTSHSHGGNKVESEALPAKHNSIIIHEEKDFMDTEETTEVIPSKTVATQAHTKPVATLQQERIVQPSSPVHRVGTDYTSTTLAVPPGSSSPSQCGSSTPAVFRFSERGTSSGRTIAPPKRYLDDDDEIFPKKRRDKPAQTKARNVVR